MNVPAFPHDFTWNVLPEAPEGIRIFDFAISESLAVAGLIVEVSLEGGDTWVGNFRGPDPRSLTLITSTPREETICVVSMGRAYLVDVFAPTQFLSPRVLPVTAVEGHLELSILILASFTDLVAIDRNGLAWESGRIAADELQIRGISPEGVSISGWDPAKGRRFEGIVDVKSGILKPRTDDLQSVS